MSVSSRLKYAKEDFSNFLDFLTGTGIIRSGLESPFSIAALPPECRSHTYALSLRLSTIQDLDLVQLEAGADAVQLKVDTWSPNLQKSIGKQVATIRRSLGVPIIFQVRATVYNLSDFGMQDNIVLQCQGSHRAYPWERSSSCFFDEQKTQCRSMYSPPQDKSWARTHCASSFMSPCYALVYK